MNLKPLEKARKKLKDIEASIYQDLAKAILANKELLVEIQNQGQLFQKGEDSKGFALRPSYASATVNYKRRNKQPTDRVTLKDTGSFYESVAIEVKGEQMIITASVPYTKYLLSRYGQDIFGVQKIAFKEFLQRYYLPLISNSFEKITTR